MSTVESVSGNVPALALIEPDGRIERTTEEYRRRRDHIPLPAQHLPAVERLLRGESDRLAIDLDGAEAVIEAVIDAGGARRALLSLPAGHNADGNPLLGARLDDSPAIVYLKDLGGRYLRVNRCYEERLGISEEQLRGKTDAELQPGETIDGPRLRSEGLPDDEPLQLEYIVAGFEERPALAVLRFAVRNSGGEPIAVCGVAAAVGQAHLARAECARLMRIERWGQLDARSIRAELLEEWGMTIVQPSASTTDRSAVAEHADAALDTHLGVLLQARDSALSERDTAVEERDAAVGERDAALAMRTELEQELEGQRNRIASLHDASATAARRAHELLAELTSERSLREQLELAIARLQEQAGAAESSLRQQAELEAVTAKLDEALAELETARGQRDRMRAELERVRTDYEGSGAERERVVAQLEALRAEQHGTNAERDRIHGELEAAGIERELVRNELETVRRERDEMSATLVAIRAEQEDSGVERARVSTELVATGAKLEAALAEVQTTCADRDRIRAELGTAQQELQRWRAQAEREAEAMARARTSNDVAQAAVGELQRQLTQTRNDSAAAVRELQRQLDEVRSEALQVVEPASLGDEPPVRWSPRAQRSFAAALCSASDWRLGLKDVIKVIGAEGGWDAVIASSTNQHGLLRCSAMWIADPALSSFESFSWQRPQSTTGTQLGEALRAPGVTWLAELDASRDRHFAAAAAQGLRSALLVPIRDGIATVGMLELLSRAHLTIDPDVTASLEAIALQLGHFAHLLRLGASPHWRLGRL